VRPLKQAVLRLAHRVGYPVLRVVWFVARPRSRGVKCVLTHDGEVLLVRHTYGRRREWDLPGGLVRRGEAPAHAARREIDEELGIALDALRELGRFETNIEHRRDTVFCFTAELPGPEVSINPVEIGEARWFPRGALPSSLGRYVDKVLETDGAGPPAPGRGEAARRSSAPSGDP
jgi:8-oxo-dGTP pyrophosphatase MutT (NUDIX family)